MSQIKNIEGQIFGKLKVISFEGLGKHKQARWRCVCSCGKETIVDSNSLKRENTKSCGCLSAETAIKIHTKHGHNGREGQTKEYRSYHKMLDRCYNINHVSYNRYGGREIIVCDRWLECFENFLEDMGPRPKGTSIDRIDNDGDYTPENCRWADSKTQNRNRKNNVWFTINERTMVQKDWAKFLGVSDDMIHNHIKKGESFLEVVEYIKSSPRHKWSGEGL
jgi:hypothetical protein